MQDDLSENPEFRRLVRRIERLESGSAQESMSVDRGRMRIGEGEFLVDGDGLFQLVGLFEQTGTYNLLSGGSFNIEDGGDLNVNTGGDVAVNNGGSLDVNDGGSVAVNDGGNVTVNDGGALEVEDGGGLNVRDGGNGVIHGGGVFTIAGTVPLNLRQIDVQGAPQAALQFGDGSADAIYGRDGNVVIQGGDVVLQLGADGLSAFGIDTGDAPHVLGIDGAGKIVKMVAGTGGDPGGPIEPGEDLGFFQWPFSLDVVTSEFGMRNGRLHAGMDFSGGAAVSGGPIPAAGDGVVIQRVEWHAGYGNYVTLRHTLPNSGIQVCTRYAHMIAPPPVELGQTVSKGDVLGLVGNTGNSFGAHLHFETHTASTAVSPVDPREFMAAYGPG